jgi:hypothetical protein
MTFARGSSEKQGQQKVQRVMPNPLIRAFVREISPVFHDKNPKSSLTRTLRAVEQAQLAQKDILACLVKAYVVAQETKTVKPQHRHFDGDNKMPLYCTMFARFVQQSVDGNFGYNTEQLATDIAADDRLVLFVVEHRLEKLLLNEQSTPILQEDAFDANKSVQEAREEVCEVEGSDPDVREDGELYHQDTTAQNTGQAEQSLCIEVEAPDMGWQTEDSAWWWSEKLRQALGRDRYASCVYPTQYGRYGFVLTTHEHPDDYWTFLTQAEVRQYL